MRTVATGMDVLQDERTTMRTTIFLTVSLSLGIAFAASGCDDTNNGEPAGASGSGGIANVNSGEGQTGGGTGGAVTGTGGAVQGTGGTVNTLPPPGDDAPSGPLPFDCPAAGWGEQLVDVGEVKLNVACRGEGTVMVMLHGYPEMHQAWNRLADAIVPMGYAIVAPDQRGYNLSDKPPNVDDYHIDRLVADIEGLIDATGQSSVLLVAHDWGAPVAFTYTHRHPERVRGLVILNGPHPDIWGNGDIDPVQKMASDAYVPSIATGIITPATAGSMISNLTPEEAMAYQTAWGLPGASVAMNNWYSANLYPDVKLITGITIAVPTLVLWATGDAYVTESELDYFPDYISNLQIERFGGDHWLTHRETDRLTTLITGFEAGLP